MTDEFEGLVGMYVPQLAKLIHENNKNLLANATINFKGFMVGNPLTERYYDLYWGYLDFLYSHSIISTQLYNQIKVVCNFTRENQLNISEPCLNLLTFNVSLEQGAIDTFSVYTDRCTNLTPYWRDTLTQPVMQAYDPCTYNYLETYFNRPDVQKAMHANSTGILYRWTGCSETLFKNWTGKGEASSLPIYQELLEAGYRLWVYSGDVDSVTPTIGTKYALESLNLPVAVPWYPWYNKQQVGGREIVYQGNLTFITVRGAGHKVPLLKPKEFLQIFGAFLNGSLLPSQPY